MTDHLKLLGVVINLVIGAGVAFCILQKAKSNAAPFLKPLALHVVLMNAAFWLLFLNRYSALNLPVQWTKGLKDVLGGVGMMFVYAICAGMVFAIWRFVSGILQKPASIFLTRLYLAGTAALVLGYGFKWLVPENGIWWKVHYGVYDSAILLFFILEIGLLVRLWLKSAGASDAVMARLGRSFAAFYLARYPIIGPVILLPPLIRAFVFFLFLNTAPVVWLRIFFRAYEERLERRAAFRPAAGADMLETVCRSRGISKREQDILGLILVGKSNRDIERELFISYHTVKNHVYNIFQKLGVKNRFELARLVEDRAREARERASGEPGP